MSIPGLPVCPYLPFCTHTHTCLCVCVCVKLDNFGGPVDNDTVSGTTPKAWGLMTDDPVTRACPEPIPFPPQLRK